MLPFDWTDTIVACATPIGVGPQTIVRTAGPNAHAIVASVLAPGVPPPPWRRRRLESASVRLEAWDRSLNVMLYVWPEGQSFTGQPACELHFVSSPPVIAAVQQALISAGGRLARPGEFTLRAFLAGRIDLAQAEGVLGLIEAESLGALMDAIDQRSGGLSRPITKLRNDLVNILADLEAGLDFAHEGIEFIAQETLLARLQDVMGELDRLVARMRSRAVELASPRVVLVGPPNAGKSSLFNALLRQERAITSPIAGTTRDLVCAPLKIHERFVELVDTAGIDQAEDGMSAQAQRFREEQARRADLVLHCVPPGHPLPEKSSLAAGVLIVHTKRDLGNSPIADSSRLSVSVHEAESMERLKHAIGERLEQKQRRDVSSITPRVRSALDEASRALGASLDALLGSLGEEIVAGFVRQAIEHLGEVVGAVYTDDLLDRVFARFCIGK